MQNLIYVPYMQDFVPIDKIREIYFGSAEEPQYINLSTIDKRDGTPNPSNVRIVHGPGLSLYFVTQAKANSVNDNQVVTLSYDEMDAACDDNHDDMSSKAEDIDNNPNVSGSIMVPPPKPGEGVSVFFKGVAHQISLERDFPSFSPAGIDERITMMRELCVDRDDYSENENLILAEETNLRLFRIVLTKAWYNGGIVKDGTNYETNGKRSIQFVKAHGDSILERRMEDIQSPISGGVVLVPPQQVLEHLGIQ